MSIESLLDKVERQVLWGTNKTWQEYATSLWTKVISSGVSISCDREAWTFYTS